MFNLKDVPFSRFGNYFAISQVNEQYYLKDLHGGDESDSKVFLLTFLCGDQPVSPTVNFTETLLIFSYNESFVRICFGEESLVNIETNNLTLKLTCLKNRYDSLLKLDDKTYHFDFYTKEIKYVFSIAKGKIIVDAPWKYVGNEYIEIVLSGKSYMVIEAFRHTVDYAKAYHSFEWYAVNVRNEYAEFYQKIAPYKNYSDSTKLATYILWSCVVKPSGIISEYAVYMSKNVMNNIWSWDNAFNAIALCKDFPELSFAQIKLFINFQNEQGAYPDFINDKFISYNCLKPPVHSWAFSLMRRHNDFFSQRDIMEMAYNSFKKQGEFWLEHRILKNMNAPLYFHGNDSGFDNASVFRKCLPVASPDLLAHLIRHFDIMADMAKELDLQQHASAHKQKADGLYELLINDFYREGSFFAKTYADNCVIPYQSSLLLCLPIIISYRLPKKVLNDLVDNIKNNFLTDFGIASEKLNSPFYKNDGYWLGPIWAAPTLLIYDALKASGYTEFAEEVKNKFFKLVKQGGMAENFNAKTGEGLSDKAFTWTSGVYLTLLKELI